MLSPADYKTGGRRRSRGLKTKTLRRMCKSKGLKTTGKKATLMKRLHMRGGVEVMPGAEGENNPQGSAPVDAALAKEPEFEDSAAAAPAPTPAAAGPTEAGRRRRRSRRREEGGRRRHSRRRVTEVALGH